VIAVRDNIVGGALTETTFLVLLAFHRPNHGYGVMQFIENETAGRVVLGAGTLYGAINALLKKGWIEPAGGGKSDARKDYAVTEKGRQIAADEQKRLIGLLRLAEKIMGGNRV
jgi:DNA-binding PadR family transcriptional regulator